MKIANFLAVFVVVCSECNGQLLSTLLGATAAVHNHVHSKVQDVANTVLGGLHHGAGSLDFNFHVGAHGQQRPDYQNNQHTPPKETVIVIVETEKPSGPNAYPQHHSDENGNQNNNHYGNNHYENGNNHPNPNGNNQGNANNYPNPNGNYQGNSNEYPNPNGNNNLPNKNQYGTIHNENNDDTPTHIDFNPNQFDFGKDKTSTSSPKRETEEKPSKEDEFDLDERFGNN